MCRRRARRANSYRRRASQKTAAASRCGHLFASFYDSFSDVNSAKSTLYHLQEYAAHRKSSSGAAVAKNKNPYDGYYASRDDRQTIAGIPDLSERQRMKIHVRLNANETQPPPFVVNPNESFPFVELKDITQHRSGSLANHPHRLVPLFVKKDHCDRM